jgi:two-component system chemotaxis sensor kinase CheA
VDQTQREFLVEIGELVEQIFLDLDELRKAATDGRARRELIDRVFRRVHSVKGLAASVGLEAVSHIAHEFESLLDAIRSGRIHPGHDVWDLCEGATDALSESLSLAASGVVEPSRRDLFERLQAFTHWNAENASGNSEAILEKIPTVIWQALTEPEKHRLVTLVREGSLLLIVSARFELSHFDQEFFRLKEKLAEFGEVISTSPAVDDKHPDKINFHVLYASAVDTQTLRAGVIEFSDVTFEEVPNLQPARAGEADGRSRKLPTVASVSSLSNFVRTDLERLDRLISSTHELFRATANALEMALSLKQAPASAQKELRRLDEQIRGGFLVVQDELINLRMVALGPTLQRAARAGRAAARASSKDIDFEIVGSELRLDKLLADTIADPLIHLVRNAVDHGIENAEARAQAGKKKRGTIRIEGVSEGSQSRVRVTDDGRGIDPQRISEAATNLGILESGSALDFERSLRLIFRPGFTTVDSVSDVSGRGVGLDVVESAVEQVGGELRVSSKPGGGTTFEIRLPVTFGLLAATVVMSGGNRYCIPASQIAHGAETGDSGDSKSDTNHLQQILLSQLLGHDAARDSRAQQLLTCRLSNERTATDGDGSTRVVLSVDKVEGTEEVLVRNLGRHAGRWYGVAGATELRDGTVALVLDLPRLFPSIP